MLDDSDLSLEKALERGITLFFEGKIEKADLHFTMMHEHYPEYMEIWPYWGFVKYNMQKWKGASDCFLKAIEHAEDYYSVYYLGSCFVQLNNYDAAERCFNRVIEILEIRDDRKPFLAFLGKGELYEHQGEYERAIQYYSEAVYTLPTPFEYEPKYKWMFGPIFEKIVSHIGTSYASWLDVWKGAVSEAIKYRWKYTERTLEKALRVYADPRAQFFCHEVFAGIYRLLGDREQAIEYFQKCLEYDVTNAIFWEQLGLCHHELKHYKEAHTALKRALELDPNDDLVRKKLSEVE